MSALPAIETAALGRTTIYVGDCRETLKRLPEQSVHCVITSPPYYGLRSYGVEPGVWGGDGACDHEWGDSERGAWANEVSGPSANVGKNGASRSRPKDAGQFCVKCGAWRGCLGLEPDVDLFLANMVDVFREVWRVLRDDGTLWLDIGDSYSGSGKGPTGQNGVGQHERRQGFDTDCRSASIPAKNLMLIPWRLLIALQADGWIVRSIISWQKAAPMPESVTDRPTSAWEPIFLLTKRGRYFYDAEAVREPNKTEGNLRDKASEAWGQSARLTPTGKGEREWNNPAGRNMWNYWRDLDDAWLLSPEPFSDAHFACVDEETEALTPNGWRRHDELEDGECIAAYDIETETWAWKPATFHRYPYDGELVSIEKRDTSQRLTPNHRCFVRRRSGVVSVVRADELKPGMEVPMAAPFSGEAEASIGPAWASLVGWYITEGYNRSPGLVYIYQSESANAWKADVIRRLLAEVGTDYTESTKTRQWRGRPSVETTWAIRGAVARRLQELAPNKGMTPSLAMLPGDEAARLLEALIAGDGHVRADGRSCIVQKDKGDIDLMQLLALRLGYRAMISRRSDGQYMLYLTRGEWLTLRGTNGSHDPIPTEYFKGVVWCPSISTTFWLARRDGKPFITGNTFPTEIPRRAILAGTSAKGVCPQCGAPWRRVMEVTRENGRNANYSLKASAGAMSGGIGEVLASTTRPSAGWQPSCRCNAGEPIPATVLDPFGGAGTTALAANRNGRNAILCELSPAYADMARRRLMSDMGMLADCSVI